MNTIKIDMTHPLKLKLAIEFISRLNKMVKFKTSIDDNEIVTFYINVDKRTIEELEMYIRLNS